MCADYKSLRDQILGHLAEIPGITCTVPEGAFYVYPNVSAYLNRPGALNDPKSGTELATRLLHEAHVVTVPGEAFGTQQHLRLSYAVSHADVDEGLARMKDFFAKLG
jgi:aspartate aminotransferase